MHEEIRVIVVDDEDIWLRSIAAALNDFGYTVAGTADNFETAAGLLSSKEYDIALLDININGKNKGIELGKMLSGIYNKPFIFITGSTDSHTVAEAVDARPSAYLTKPVHPASLLATVQSAINNFSSRTYPATAAANVENNSFFFIKQGNKYRKIDWMDVVYARAEQNYTVIYNDADKTEYYIRSTLSKTLGAIIPAHLRTSFLQVNRGEAVQLKFVQEIATDEVRTPQRAFSITESFRQAVKNAVTMLS